MSNCRHSWQKGPDCSQCRKCGDTKPHKTTLQAENARLTEIVSEQQRIRDQQRAENARLTSEVARLSKDAARYQWLRKVGHPQFTAAMHHASGSMDEFIDRCLAKP